jgi:hypothetical protein
VVAELAGFNVGSTIASITVASATSNSGGFRLNHVQLGQYSQQDPPDLDFVFTLGALAIKDGDGDTAEQPFNIHLDGSSAGTLELTGTNAPIGVDLDDDGVEYLSREDGVVFTDQQTGESVNTAWVGPEDGMLVFDANRSGTVDATEEYVFTEWSETAETDMEALAEVFDTNKDGVLDKQDEQWDQFAVWQDKDSDGVTDEGELVSLEDLGVESIALNYSDESEAGTAADGDVVIHGQSEVTWTDGSTTVAEDTSFAISAADVIVDEDSVALPAGEEGAVVLPTDEAGVDVGVQAGDDSVLDPAAIELDILLTNNQTKFDTGADE